MRISVIVAAFFVLIGLFIVANFGGTGPIGNYSDGERVGQLRKLSKKGLFCKTWEGELMLNAGMGTVKLDTFSFSVENDSIANELSKVLGQNVIVKYDQYLFVPHSTGNKNYLVTGFETLDSN